MSDDRRARASREATLVQRRAADPARSVSLRASAGSGKTKVLVDRIVRLLLVKAPLKSVVALTFTRKAAVEIKERLRERLGELARLDEAGLERELGELLGRPPERTELARAAVIYEEVLEDASGLLVGTIHTFCQTLLKRFADEAGVDPAFAILENTDDLWDEALSGLEAELGREKDAAADLAALSPDPAAARKLLRGIRDVRLELDRWCDRLGGAPGAERSPLLPALVSDLAAHLFRDTALAEVADPTPEDLRTPALEAARAYAGPGLDAVLETHPAQGRDKLASELQIRRDVVTAAADRLVAGDDMDAALEDLFDAALTQAGTPRLTKCGTRKEPHASARRDAVETAAAPVLALRRLNDLVDLQRRNALWLRFGLRALDRYADLKSRDRCLDFHDLEREAWRLVRDLDVGPWILYRLDARLDHLLVDEFQDTNRNQWEILRPFAEEFLAGAAEDGRDRSAFFVGDVKQSIYGFRGARPGIFGEAETLLAEMTGESVLTLPTNFRSLPAVVGTVGEVFGAPPLSELLPPGEAETAAQIPYREGEGRVLITAPVATDDGEAAHEDAAAWARRAVQRILRDGRVVEDGVERPARCSDILLLARTRTHLAAYESELRRAGIPVVPAGRGALARSREVQDLLLLLRWLVFPADDAALAGILRSPLFRAGEADFQRLLDLRLKRGAARGSLWDALRAEDAPPALAAAAARLGDWSGRVGRESVHRLLRRIYRDVRAPRAFGAALGEQARYNLLRLHDMALDHDRTAFPSVRGFLAEVERAAVREDQEEAVLPDGDGGRVRMMTIHGAKGLEAPFVLLVDHAHPMDREPERLVLDGRHGESGPLVTGLRKPHRDPDAGTAVSAAAVRAMSEVRREQADLLYVAMTRARNELIALGAAPARNADKPSFARWLESGPRGFDETPDWLEHDDDDAAAPGPGTEAAPPRTWEPCGWRPLVEISSPSRAPAPPLPEDTLNEDRVAARETADGAVDPPSPDPAAREAARAHGVAVHAWLERAAETGAMPPGDGPARAEARAVFHNPAYAWIFRPDDGEALCEAPIIARGAAASDGVETRTLGIVDRLLLRDAETVIVDYKSNRVAETDLPAVVAHYRPQMHAYRDALAAIRPDRPVRLHLLFTGLEGPDGPGRLIEID